MWETPVPIFDDEDEDELIGRFVKLSARYPDREPMEICGVIFENLQDPIMRANQAAMIWSKDLDIIERIEAAKLNGGEEEKPVETKAMKLRKLEALYNDGKLPVRDRLKAIELHARITGEIDGEGGDDNKARRTPVFNFAIHPSQANAG